MKYTLSEYLPKFGPLTGPLKVPTRHSHLSLIKTLLGGGKVSFGFKAYNNFGSYVHEKYLMGNSAIKLNSVEKLTAAKMLLSLNSHPVAQELMKDTIREVRLTTTLMGVRISYTPDAKKKVKRPKKGKGVDLKTTMCASKEDFIDKGFEYGYFRQGDQYGLSENMDEFFIIAIMKRSPFGVMIIRLQDYPDKMKYVRQELTFLLYFWRHYGTFTIIKRSVMRGSEAITQIEDVVRKAYLRHREFKNLRKRLMEMVKNFPPSEKELYQERIQKALKRINSYGKENNASKASGKTKKGSSKRNS